MKKIVFYLFCILISALIISALPVSGEEKLYDSVIRLHILANSDSEEDQSLKLDVRDRILEEYSEPLSKLKDRADAEERIRELLPQIEDFAENYVKIRGYDYPVSATVSYENYPRCDYEDFSFPSGRYLSLRINIGSGAGHNWWCVLFPPMCTQAALGYERNGADIPSGLTKEQYSIISESDSSRYVVKFKVLEILEKTFE